MELQIANRVKARLCQLHVEHEGMSQCDVYDVGSVRTGVLDVVRFEGFGTPRGLRRSVDIRPDDADFYIFTLPLNAHFQVCQRGEWREAKPGQFFLFSTAQPFQTVINAERKALFSSLHARVPGPLLRQRLPAIDLLGGSELPLDVGGGIVRSLLELATREGHAFTVRQASQLGELIFESIFEVLDWISRRRLGTQQAVSLQRLAQCRYQAELYIRANLADASLSPVQIAHHCRISVRQLYNVFAHDGVGVSAYIREQRLILCQQALSDRLASKRSITEIAQDFGFDDPANFSRMYKRRFGRSPRMDRVK